MVLFRAFALCSRQMFQRSGGTFNHMAQKPKRQSSDQQLLWKLKNVGHVPECCPFMLSGVVRCTVYYDDGFCQSVVDAERDVLFMFQGCWKWHKVAGFWPDQTITQQNYGKHSILFLCYVLHSCWAWNVRVGAEQHENLLNWSMVTCLIHILNVYYLTCSQISQVQSCPE